MTWVHVMTIKICELEPGIHCALQGTSGDHSFNTIFNTVMYIDC